MAPARRLPGPLCVVCGEFGAADATLNVLLFFPLGLGLALAGGRAVHVGWMALASVGIEVAQLFLVGRHASVGDVVMNSAGAALGFFAGRNFDKLVQPGSRVATRMLAVWSGAWLLMQFVASYALLPAPTTSLYYGQIARDLGGLLRAFPGSVLDPQIAGLALPDWDVPSEPVRRALTSSQGAPVRARVVARSCPEGRAGIVRIADAESRGIVLLAQDGPDLVFSVRTRADAMRLRDVVYRLSNVFGNRGCVAAGDTILLEAVYTRRAVTLRATNDGHVREARLTPTPFEGWRLFAPYAPEGARATALLTALWLCLLALPAGYFWWRLAGRLVDLAVVGALIGGSFVIPAALGVAAASWHQLLALLTGVVFGALLTRIAQSRIRPRG